MSEILHVNAPDLNRMPQVLNLKRNPPRLICGHHPMHGQLYQLLPDQPVAHITMLRDPIARVVSYYNYISGRPEHPLHAAVSAMDFDAFVANRELSEIHNGQARRLAGWLHRRGDCDDALLLDLASDVLQKCFTAVLLTEQFNLSLLLLQQILGLKDVFYVRQNRSLQRLAAEQLDPAQRQQIARNNAVDMQLYAQAIQLFEKQCQTHLQSADVSAFNQLQQRHAELLAAADQKKSSL